MKKLLLALLFSAPALGAMAQSHPITVYCTIDGSGAEEYFHKDVYPDSVKKAILIDYRKLHNLRDGQEALMWMNLAGWKLVSVTTQNGGVFAHYFISLGITLSDQQYNQYLENLQNMHAKKKKS